MTLPNIVRMQHLFSLGYHIGADSLPVQSFEWNISTLDKSIDLKLGTILNKFV